MRPCRGTLSKTPSEPHRLLHRELIVSPGSSFSSATPLSSARIREGAEAEERENYEGGRLPVDWREALQPLGTTSEKTFLETVPWLVVVFEERYGLNPDGSKRHNWYVKESVGIACGLFIAALHHMGLATLTHTPSPMAFLNKILDRPRSERPFILFPVGYPAEDCTVPDLVRKPLTEVMIEVPER